MKASLALLSLLAVTAAHGAETPADGLYQVAADTPCNWSSAVNGISGRICLSRSHVLGGTPLVVATLTLRNGTRSQTYVVWQNATMRYSIVDANGAAVTTGINVDGQVGGSITRGERPQLIVPPRGEVSFQIPGGGGVMRDKAAVLQLGTFETIFAFEPTDRPLFLRAVLEIPRDASPRQGAWSGHIVFPDVRIPLGLPPATSLQPLVPVAGRALDADLKPVVNARIGIFRGVSPDNAPCPRSIKPEDCLDYLFSIGADRAHAITGENGHFTLQVPGGLVQEKDVLWAEGVNARGERIRQSRMIDASLRWPVPPVDILVLEHVADFTALIQHEGQPVSGALVNFFSDLQRTDATGSVTTHRNLRPAANAQLPLFMTVRADGFATEYLDGGFGPGTTTQVIELVREAEVTGRIVDAGGRTLRDANLTATFLPNAPGLGAYLEPVVSAARTDATGTFTLHGLHPGQRYRVVISTDAASAAGTERTITAGDGPIDITLPAAVPVTLAVSGLRGPWPPAGQQRAMDALDRKMNSMIIEDALSAQLEPVPGISVWTDGPGLTILMDWLDPESGTWLPVFSPRKVSVKDATHADLRFEKVPVGIIRVSTIGGTLPIAVQTFDPVTIRAGRPVRIPVQVTALQQVEVKVTNREGQSQ